MSRTERIVYASALLVVMLMCLAYTAEHIYIAVEAQRNPPQLVEACPVPKGGK